MSELIGTYSFLPWLRHGIANQITAIDMDNSVKLRSTIDVKLKITGDKVDSGQMTEEISRKMQLYGPGDIVGIEKRAIIKTEPRDWITNFEPNYLPYIDFYDEDFAWRYTPAVPDSTHRLRPWIMLVILKEKEFSEGKNMKGRPLPYIEVKDAAKVFPVPEQLWAWSHIHVNTGLSDKITSTDMNAVMPKFQQVLNNNPDLAYCRIICPRKLEANTAYHAFLIPTFESGRLAGLGVDPAETPFATHSAWKDYPSGARIDSSYHPYYHRWYFRTGTVGDFEYLVRLLEAKPMNKEVGRRDMDVQYPGSNISGIDKEGLNGVLKLGGALQIPYDTLKKEDKADVDKYNNWYKPFSSDFQNELAVLINLADEYEVKSAKDANDGTNITGVDGETDPMITPPIYGRWHAMVSRLIKDRDNNDISLNYNWVHELNLDPRFRVAAGFGTLVIQDKQEEYMDAAWEQVGDIIEANRKIRQAQLAKMVSLMWYKHHLKPLISVNPEKSFVMTAPVQTRIVNEGETVFHQVKTSTLHETILSTTVRRVLRPRGRIMKRLVFDSEIRPDNLLTRINEINEVTAALPKTVSPEVLTVDEIVDDIVPEVAPPLAIGILKRFPWLKYLLLILGILVIMLFFIFGASAWLVSLGGVIASVCGYFFYLLSKWSKKIEQVESLKEENQTPEAVDKIPKSPDFIISTPGEGFTPSRGRSDSVEAVNFKTALKDVSLLVTAGKAVAYQLPKKKLKLKPLTNDVITAINPQITIPKRVMLTLYIPGYILSNVGETFKEAMAYPEFDFPMYKPLVEISTELFLPNINKIEQNSISLLETNQKFIESYMVGLNHEFARELMWREYPTDQRGSYFRQFWDPSGYLDTKGLDKEKLKEKLRDIPPLHLWPKKSKLDSHDHREQGGDKEEEVVLVIRGELLKKYPTAVIYAHKARWQKKDGKIDPQKERRLVELEGAETTKPPRRKVKTPLYEAKIDPDIYFFGFDLTVKEAKGGTGKNEDDEPGWFFVIKERPGEPRFGLDIDQSNEIHVWNDLSWQDIKTVSPGSGDAEFIDVGSSTVNIEVKAPTLTEDMEKEEQHKEDVAIKWNQNTNSADLAYILYQAPMMVAVHAAEMLTKGS